MDADGKLWFLDINFRNSTWSLTSMKAGMSLPINLDERDTRWQDSRRG